MATLSLSLLSWSSAVLGVLEHRTLRPPSAPPPALAWGTLCPEVPTGRDGVPFRSSLQTSAQTDHPPPHPQCLCPTPKCPGLGGAQGPWERGVALDLPRTWTLGPTCPCSGTSVIRPLSFVPLFNCSASR